MGSGRSRPAGPARAPAPLPPLRARRAVVGGLFSPKWFLFPSAEFSSARGARWRHYLGKLTPQNFLRTGFNCLLSVKTGKKKTPKQQTEHRAMNSPALNPAELGREFAPVDPHAGPSCGGPKRPVGGICRAPAPGGGTHPDLPTVSPGPAALFSAHGPAVPLLGPAFVSLLPPFRSFGRGAGLSPAGSAPVQLPRGTGL